MGSMSRVLRSEGGNEYCLERRQPGWLWVEGLASRASSRECAELHRSNRLYVSTVCISIPLFDGQSFLTSPSLACSSLCSVSTHISEYIVAVNAASILKIEKRQSLCTSSRRGLNSNRQDLNGQTEL